MNTTIKLALSLAFGISMLAGMPTSAAAQEDVSQKQVSSLELNQADVREALRSVFKNVNVSYSIAPEVQGTVTVSLKNVTLEVALQNILRQVDATYRIEAGVYEILKKQAEDILVGGNVDPHPVMIRDTYIRRIKFRHGDPETIAILLGASKGNQNFQLAPEKSTIDKTPHGGGQGGLGGGSGSAGGRGNGGGFGGGSGGFGGSTGGFGGNGGGSNLGSGNHGGFSG